MAAEMCCGITQIVNAEMVFPCFKCTDRINTCKNVKLLLLVLVILICKDS